MSGKQHKREEKARRREEREKIRQAERRRNIMTGIVAGFIVIIGGVLVAISLDNDEVDLEQLASEAAASASEAAASELPPASEVPSELAGSEGPAIVVPDDPSIEPGARVDSGLPGQVDDRPMACDADEPGNAADERPQFPGGPADVLQDGVDYVAVVETSCGSVTFDLLEDDSPVTVNSFVFLAQQGFFDGLEIFRNATSIGALQTGGGDQTNGWRIGYSLPDELGLAQSGGYPVGSVAMANAGANTGGSQFFFVYNESFDTAFEGAENYAVFGQVLEGLDVLEEIGAIAVDGETPTERVYMNTVTIEER